MRKLNKVTPLVMCMADNCAMAGQCSRYRNYAESRKTDSVLRVLNQELLEIGEHGCEYLHISREVVVARGFKKMYETIPHGSAVGVWRGFPGYISRRQFYRLLNGEVTIGQEEQEAILAFLAAKGADVSCGFDAYETVNV